MYVWVVHNVGVLMCAVLLLVAPVILVAVVFLMGALRVVGVDVLFMVAFVLYRDVLSSMRAVGALRCIVPF